MSNPLKAHRERIGLSRSQLGALLGVSGSQVGYWERSDLVPSSRYVARIAEVFGVSSSKLENELLASRQVFERLAQVKVTYTDPAAERDD